MPSVDYEAALRIQNAARQIPGGIDALMNGRAEDLLNERANALAMAQGSEERRTALLTSAIGMMTQQAQRKDDRSFMAELEQKKMEFAERMAEQGRQHEERMLMLQIGAKRRGGGGGRKKAPEVGAPSPEEQAAAVKVDEIIAIYGKKLGSELPRDFVEARDSGNSEKARLLAMAYAEAKKRAAARPTPQMGPAPKGSGSWLF